MKILSKMTFLISARNFNKLLNLDLKKISKDYFNKLNIF